MLFNFNKNLAAANLIAKTTIQLREEFPLASDLQKLSDGDWARLGVDPFFVEQIMNLASIAMKNMEFANEPRRKREPLLDEKAKEVRRQKKNKTKKDYRLKKDKARESR